MNVKKITGYTIFLNEMLGKGAYGTVKLYLIQVYLCEKDATKERMAIKVINKAESKDIYNDSYLR